jgi:Oxidoreductase family, NAD-binding Rossmann fold
VINDSNYKVIGPVNYNLGDEPMKDISRRKFLKGMGVAGSMLIVGEQLLNLHSHAIAANAARDRMRVAIAGLGNQGQVVLESFLKVAGVEVVALCDIDDDALRKARARIDSSRLKCVHDVRHILDDPAVDAIAIATPSHWHTLMGVWACEAGKHCYIESPCSHSYWEGLQLVEAARKHKRIVQYGSLGRLSDLSGFDPVEFACLGDIQSTRTVVYVPTVSRKPRHQSIAGSRLYDLWLGPAPVFSGYVNDWRYNSSMHNGELGFFALDNVHRNLQLLGSHLPVRVTSISTRPSWQRGGASFTAVQMAFAREGTRFDLELVPSSALPHTLKPHAATVISETTVKGINGSITAVVTKNQELETEFLVSNFVAAVREQDQKLLISPIDEAHVSCGSLHLANISSILHRPVDFDPLTQSSDDLEVNELLRGKHRPPYVFG